MITMLTTVIMMTTIWLHFGYSGTNVQVKNPPSGMPCSCRDSGVRPEAKDCQIVIFTCVPAR